jgi:hypothetical protein
MIRFLAKLPLERSGPQRLMKAKTEKLWSPVKAAESLGKRKMKIKRFIE